MNNPSLSVVPFVLSFLISLFLTPLTILIFKALGWVVDPKKSPHPAHIHKEPVPKGGGLPIFLSVFLTVFYFLGIDKHLLAIFLACILVVAVGLVDDIRGVNPYVRLVFNFLAVAVVVSAGIGIAYISNPLGGMFDFSAFKLSFDLWGSRHEIWLLADLFALIWIPVLMNAINWSSGVDGQISGVVTIAALVVGVTSLWYSADITQWPVSVLAFALAGAFASFTIFHFYPQKIMPGYSATTLAGLLLGVVSILATAKVGTLLIVLAVPLIDFGYLIVKRIMSGKSPVWGDKSHLHHTLINMGWGKRRVALFYWIITSILGLIALRIEARAKLLVLIALMIFMLYFLLWQHSSRYSKK